MGTSALFGLVAGVATCLLGCGTAEHGSEPATPAHEPLCDGSQRMRIRFFAEPQVAARGSGVEPENGAPSFFIDGECNYWIDPEWELGRQTSDWRKGHLPSDLEAEINKLPLGHLDTLGGCAQNTFDAPRLIITDASSWECAGQGPDVEDAWRIVDDRTPQLWVNATPLTGGIRVSAVTPLDDTSKIYTWPSSTPLRDFLLPEDAASSIGVSGLVSDLEEASALRALRDEYVAESEATPGRFGDGQRMSDGTTLAYVYMRDQLPYEDGRGLLSFDAGP